MISAAAVNLSNFVVVELVVEFFFVRSEAHLVSLVNAFTTARITPAVVFSRIAKSAMFSELGGWFLFN